MSPPDSHKSTFKPTKRQELATDIARGTVSNILYYGGSRSGKTYLICRLLIVRALRAPGSTHAIARRYFRDCRQKIGMLTLPEVLDTMGIKYEINKTDWIFTLHNGSQIWICGLDANEETNTADESEKILGAEFSTIFYNECNQIPFPAIETANTRLAEKNCLDNKSFYDCNPPNKGHWVYKLFIKCEHPEDKTPLEREDYVHMQMNPVDNMENIDPAYLKKLRAMGRKKRKRFLDGEFTDEVQGKVFDQEDINNNRVTRRDVSIADMDVLIAAFDPNMTSKPGSDDCGIMLMGRRGRHIYLFKDNTMIRPKPAAWARKGAAMAHHYGLNYIVAEVNQGGELVATAIKHARREGEMPIKVVMVFASNGKFARAEPVAELYELGFIHHVGMFEELEEEQVGFDPDTMKKSPDRVDALVWGVTDLSTAEMIECSDADDDEEPASSAGKSALRELSYEDVYTMREMCEMDDLFN